VKLLLDESQETKYGPSLSSQNLLRKYGKDAIQVSGEFVKHLVTHAKSTLQRRFGGASVNMGCKYIFTVPAVWSDKAKDATLKAALMADIKPDEVFLVSEPEAAALYSLRSIQPNSVTVSAAIKYRIICF
jgi:molecular chaperone DnaK (HSP70)